MITVDDGELTGDERMLLEVLQRAVEEIRQGVDGGVRRLYWLLAQSLESGVSRGHTVIAAPGPTVAFILLLPGDRMVRLHTW